MVDKILGKYANEISKHSAHPDPFFFLPLLKMLLILRFNLTYSAILLGQDLFLFDTINTRPTPSIGTLHQENVGRKHCGRTTSLDS